MSDKEILAAIQDRIEKYNSDSGSWKYLPISCIDDIEQIISSRSESPQQGTEGAEEVLKEIWIGKDVGMLLTESDALAAMHHFAQSQVEQAVKELKGIGVEKDRESNTIATASIYIADYNASVNADIPRTEEISKLLVSYMNSRIFNTWNKEDELDEANLRISQLEHALKVQTEHVADLMASSLVRPELKIPSDEWVRSFDPFSRSAIMIALKKVKELNKIQ